MEFLKIIYTALLFTVITKLCPPDQNNNLYVALFYKKNVNSTGWHITISNNLY